MPHENVTAEPHRRSRGAQLDVVLFCALIAVCAAVVGGLAWTRPSGTVGVTKYVQSGTMSYTGSTSPASIYGSAGLSTGEPIYTSALTKVTIRYAYRMDSAAPMDVSGTEKLLATMSNGQGISRTVTIQPSTSFRGDGFVATGVLSLRTLEAIANTFAQTSGSTASYPVTISPVVRITGRLDTLPLLATFHPSVPFTFDSNVLTPSGTSASTSGSAGTNAGGAASASTLRPFKTTLVGSIRSTGVVPSRLFLGLSVAQARIVSLALLVAALFFGALIGLPLLYDATSDDERMRISTRFGQSLVEVQAIPGSSALVIVEVSSFGGLNQVARRLECPILHHSKEGLEDTYMVMDNGTLYRYRVLSAPSNQVGGRSSLSDGDGRSGIEQDDAPRVPVGSPTQDVVPA